MKNTLNGLQKELLKIIAANKLNMRIHGIKIISHILTSERTTDVIHVDFYKATKTIRVYVFEKNGNMINTDTSIELLDKYISIYL
jgi:hypothetical protein